jgi:hypothetical protein
MPTVQEAYAVGNFRYSTSLSSTGSDRLDWALCIIALLAFPLRILKGRSLAVVIELVEMR